MSHFGGTSAKIRTPSLKSVLPDYAPVGWLDGVDAYWNFRMDSPSETHSDTKAIPWFSTMNTYRYAAVGKVMPVTVPYLAVEDTSEELAR